MAVVDSAYRLSVVIATTVGWPGMRLSPDSVLHGAGNVFGCALGRGWSPEHLR